MSTTPLPETPSRATRTIKGVARRISGDYLASDRMWEYREILARACTAGYRLSSVRDYYRDRKGGSVSPLTVVLRHDIDTDPRRVVDFVRIEREFGALGTYYYRLSTLDFDAMERIEADGGESSYHYEEIASYAKRFRLHDPQVVRRSLPAIRGEFVSNYQRIKDATDLPMISVAAHGDFANRRLGIVNHELLDTPTRARCGILVEAYDPEIRTGDLGITDRPTSIGWTSSPQGAIDARIPLIHLLTHPRHWGRRPWVNTKDSARRVFEDLTYRLPTRFPPDSAPLPDLPGRRDPTVDQEAP